MSLAALDFAPRSLGVAMFVLGLMPASPAPLSARVGVVNRREEKTRHRQAAEERQQAAPGTSPGNRTSQTIEGGSIHEPILRGTSPDQGTVPLSDCSLA